MAKTTTPGTLTLGPGDDLPPLDGGAIRTLVLDGAWDSAHLLARRSVYRLSPRGCQVQRLPDDLRVEHEFDCTGCTGLHRAAREPQGRRAPVRRVPLTGAAAGGALVLFPRHQRLHCTGRLAGQRLARRRPAAGARLRTTATAARQARQARQASTRRSSSRYRTAWPWRWTYRPRPTVGSCSGRTRRACNWRRKVCGCEARGLGRGLHVRSSGHDGHRSTNCETGTYRPCCRPIIRVM